MASLRERFYPALMPDAPLRLPTVQLLHELPDGSAHVDWMIAADPDGREPLVTFRLSGRVDELSPAGRANHAIDAERIADHRVIYLEYEGPLAGAPGASPDTPDRGTVRRLRRGWVVRWDRGAPAWEMSIIWQGDDVPQRIRVEPLDGARWRVRDLSSGDICDEPEYRSARTWKESS